MTSADDARQVADDAAREKVRELFAGILSSSVNGGSGAPMLTPVPTFGDDEPVEGDEHWIDHDGLTEPEQDGWR